MGAVQELIDKALKRANVQITVCSHRYFDIDSMDYAIELLNERKHNFHWRKVKGDALISRARSRAVSQFLKEKQFDVILFIDDDIIFKPEDAVKLVDECLNKKDIIGGFYVQKKTLAKTCVFFDGQQVEFSRYSKPVEVESIATGFMAVHREALEKIISNKDNSLPNGDKFLRHCYRSDPSYSYYNFFNPFTMEKGNDDADLSEDWAFCVRARLSGVSVRLEPSIFLEHRGEASYDLRDKARPPKVSWEEFDSITLK